MLSFKATSKLIDEFVCELYAYFGEEDAPSSLKMYHRLLTTMTTGDDDLARINVRAFESFCVTNREQIRKRTRSWVSPRVRISDKIYIDIEYIMNHVEHTIEDTIWDYLTAIAAYIDPEARTKDMIDHLRGGTDSKEHDFLVNMIEGISKSVMSEDTLAQSQNPLELLTAVSQSGLFTDLQSQLRSGVENGDLNPEAMLSSVTSVLQTLTKEIDGDSPLATLMSSIIPPLSTPTKELE